jgi:hypothetical protein
MFIYNLIMQIIVGIEMYVQIFFLQIKKMANVSCVSSELLSTVENGELELFRNNGK